MFPESMLERLAGSAVIAGFAIDDAAKAVPLAQSLVAGGISAIELTLRTPAAMDAIKAIHQEVPKLLLGVGTVLTPEQLHQVKDAGADFAVSPGTNPTVIQAAKKASFPFAPGIATPSDLEQAIELGCRFVKFFPAQPLGGISYLKSMAAPYKHLGIEYFPLGGVNSENFQDYLMLENVPCIGGSWIVKKELVDQEDWARITARASEVMSTLQQGAKYV
ncbi:MAG: bifunctional 4-hydroxy-2-oxoglutarate aldolase/2-dehydro-3-deoxy-phosphogluconate aldolase [Verrucomicrobiota bacterium]